MAKATSMIYGGDLILKTKNVLKQYDSIDENAYLKLIESYFVEVQKQASVINGVYYDALLQLNFEDVGKFSFIEDEYASESVFIQLNQKAKTAWNDYTAIYGNDKLDNFEKKAAFAKIKSTFYDFVINVPVTRGETSISFDSEKQLGFYVSQLHNPSDFYHYESGNFFKNTGYQDLKNFVL
jgi:CRISPR-associated endonuclease/helicase Cas3